MTKRRQSFCGWMVIGPDGAELDTVRPTRAEAIEKFCDRAFHVPTEWADRRREGYRATRVKVSAR